MDRRGGEPREAPRTRLFITLGRCPFGIERQGAVHFDERGNTRRPATNRRPFHQVDVTRFSSRDDAPAVETNTPEVGRIQASAIRLSMIVGSRVPDDKSNERRTR